MSQTHHVSYNPEITTVLSKDEHIRIHRHGTGRVCGAKYPKNFRIENMVLTGRMNIIKNNTSRYLLLPKSWLVAQVYFGRNLDSFSVIGSKNILVLVPTEISDNPEKIREYVNELLRKLEERLKKKDGETKHEASS